jgi:hypothetical protein
MKTRQFFLIFLKENVGILGIGGIPQECSPIYLAGEDF